MCMRIRIFWVWAIVFLFLHGNAFGQVGCVPPTDKAPCGKHEIALNVFSWIDIPLEKTNTEAAHVRYIQTACGGASVVNGLLYTFHCRRHWFILGVDYFRYAYKDVEQPGQGSIYPWYFQAQGSYIAGEGRIGYRRLFGKDKFIPFAGIDIAYRHARKEGSYEGSGDIGPPFNYSGTTRMNSDQVLGSLLGGVAYRINRRWVIRFEAGCSLGVGWTRSEPDGKKIQEDLDVYNPIRTLAVGYEL